MKASTLILLLQATSCLAFQPGTSPSAAVHRRTAATSLASSSDGNDNNPFGFLQDIFSSSSSTAVAKPEPRIPDVVVDTDYTLAAAFGVVGVSIVALNHGVSGVLGGGFISLLASLFAVQATRLRFVFDEDCFELKAVESIDSEDLTNSGENIVVGGANRWAYDTFVNWDFFPSFDVPILVYFKETQTAEDGQIHFFPAIANVKQLKEQVCNVTC